MTRVVQNLLLILMLCLECFGAPGSAISVPAARSKSPAALYFRPVRIGVVFGEQYDPDLGLYYLRARFYSPQSGRFWNMDSWEGEKGNPITLNKYLYGNANPILYTDPSGNFGIGGSLGAVSIAMNISGMQIDAGFAILDGARSVFGTTPQLQALLAAKSKYDKISLALGIAGATYGVYKLVRWVGSKGISFGRRAAKAARRTELDATNNHLFSNLIDDVQSAKLMPAYQVIARKKTGHFNYVVMPGGQLRLGDTGLGRGIRNGHADLAEGKKVFAAGEVIFKDGKVVHMNNSSGHYNFGGLSAAKSASQKRNAVSAFRDNGLGDISSLYEDLFQ